MPDDLISDQLRCFCVRIKMFSLYFLLVLFCNNVLSDEPVLKLAQGKVQGSVRENFLGGTFYSFQGIPYAKPPVGPLRFKVRFN